MLLSSLVYGTVYAVEKHKHSCDPALQRNMEHSLFTLWIVFGALVAGLGAYHFSASCKSKDSYAAPSKDGYAAEGLLSGTAV